MEENQKFHWAEGMKFAAESLKTLFLLNGAATVAILSFIGNAQDNSKCLVLAMVFYALGALVGPLGFFAAYFTQLKYGNDDTNGAEKSHIFTYAVCFFGIVMFVFGTAAAAFGLLD